MAEQQVSGPREAPRGDMPPVPAADAGRRQDDVPTLALPGMADPTVQATQVGGLDTDRTEVSPETADGHRAPAGATDAAGSTHEGSLPPAASRARISVPDRVGRYLIRECLGQGGMGVVYKAQDPGIGRDVAIKFLHATLCEQPEARSRFLREARAAGRLSHPGIVTVHDVGEIDGRPYMAMELLEGRPLANELGDGPPLSVRDAVEIGIQLARTLDYAHARGIVHRDIKPGNIMRAAGSSAIKVTDFGIAHIQNLVADHHTRVGSILGTPAYMSPEQAQGRKLDGRSDLFAAGVVLYEMLAGRRPFAGEGVVALALSIIRDEPAAIGTLRPDAPASLCRIVERCLAKTPEDRFQSGAELAEALQDVLAQIDDMQRQDDRLRGLPLGVKSAAAMALVVAVVMSVAAVFVTQRQQAALVGQAVDSGAAVSRLIALQNAVPALAEDWTAVEVAVQRAMKTRAFRSIAVIGRDGIVRAADDARLVGRPDAARPGRPLADHADGTVVSRLDADGASVLGFRTPITFQDVPVGTVVLELDEEPIARLARLSMALMALFVVVTVLAVAVAAHLVVVHWFSRPMKVLVSAMEEIGAGRLGHRLGERGGGEFGRLYVAFDRMARLLQDRQAAPPAPSPPSPPQDDAVPPGTLPPTLPALVRPVAPAASEGRG